jgi:hypothetical protein
MACRLFMKVNLENSVEEGYKKVGELVVIEMV